MWFEDARLVVSVVSSSLRLIGSISRLLTGYLRTACVRPWKRVRRARCGCGVHERPVPDSDAADFPVGDELLDCFADLGQLSYSVERRFHDVRKHRVQMLMLVGPRFAAPLEGDGVGPRPVY